VCLRLDTSLCNPHICRASVDAFATHGLSCKWSEGRHFRHSSINDIIRRALYTANVPSRLEPPGVFRSDGTTMFPWGSEVFCLSLGGTLWQW